MRIVVSIAFAFNLILWPEISATHGHAAFIQMDPEISWCCSPGRDCNPAEVYYTAQGWAVVGMEGSLRRGDRGLYENRSTPNGGPWACNQPGTRKLRCIILPETRT